MSGLLKNTLRNLVERLLKVYLASLPRKAYEPQKIEGILVFAYHGLGNFIMYTPALKLLRERFPNARIDLQVGNNTGCEEVLAGAKLFDNIYNVPYSAGFRGWLKRLREIRQTAYDITINEFHSHSWQLALTLVFSGAAFRVGHVTSPGWLPEFSRYSFVFNVPVAMREDEHEIERYLDLITALGVERTPTEPTKPFMYLTEADRRFAQTFLQANGNRNLILGIQPGTSPTMRWKQWSLEKYRELIERLVKEQPDAQIVLFGAPNEAAMIQELAEGINGNIVIAAGKTTVKQVAALIERCNLLVCNDSGLMHVAVAVQTPVVAIYGPTDFNRTAPLGSEHSIIRHKMSCSPCFKLSGDATVKACPHHDCLNSIAADEVYYQVESKIAVKRKVESEVQSA
ncbi:MAG: lipopolysaccharide heptosyltransferase II [Acidobacteriota bacterium]